MRPLRVRATAGVTLIEVLVAVGILGLVAFATAAVLQHFGSFNSSLSRWNDVETTRSMLLRRLSCQTTRSKMAGKACNGSYVDLYDANGSLLVGRGGTRVGDWTVRAYCQNDLFYAQIAGLKPGRPITTAAPADFKQDPLTHQSEDWTAMAAKFFPAGVSPCEPMQIGPDSAVFAQAGEDQNVSYGVYTKTRFYPSVDRLGEFSGSPGTTFTAKYPGMYAVSYTVGMKPPGGSPGTNWLGGGCIVFMTVSHGGTPFLPLATTASYPDWNWRYPGAVTNYCTTSASANVYLHAGDSIALISAQTLGTGLGTYTSQEVVTAQSSFSIVRLQ